MKSEDKVVIRVDDFRFKKPVTDHLQLGKMDSTNVKIFSVVGESFEKK
jgi:hypothetical protein